MAAKITVSKVGEAAADRALALANDLRQEIQLVQMQLGYDTADLSLKRRFRLDTADLADIIERLNKVSLANVQR